MADPAVHWYEGLFLRPHHLQASQRYGDSQTNRLAATLLPYAWGCRTLEIDLDALANHRFLVRRLTARMPDGMLLSIPTDGTLAPLDLNPLLERQPVITVSLAVPVLRPGRANVSENDSERLLRYRLDSMELDDENTGGDPEVVVRRSNVQLIASDRDTTGYVLLPLAKVERSDRADGRPRLSPGYIPPLLASDAWAELWAGILQAIYDRIGRKVDLLANQVQARGIGVESGTSWELTMAGQLRSLNEASTVLHAVAFTPGLHPITAYTELCRIVGLLALFGATRRPPPLPKYDHDDLGKTFFPLKRAIDELLDRVVEPEFKERPFLGAGLRMQVELEPAWVEASWQLFIAAQSTLMPDELVRVLTQPGVLDMKVGSSERVDSIFRNGRAGLRFLPVRLPPRVLPSPAGIAYFQLAAEPTGGEWPEVQKSLSLAVRINENRVVGNIQGQRDLTVQIGSQTTTVRFTLYAVPVRSLTSDGELTGNRAETTT